MNLLTTGLISFGFLVCLVGCAPPKQPPLTPKEEKYINFLKTKSGHNVEREIDPGLLLRNPEKKKGEYTLGFDSVPCSIVESDIMKSKSYEIANYLYNVVLGQDSVYDKIIIAYSCNTGINQYKNKYFEFNADSLRRIR